jgi:succinylglutamate desuccinylase
MRARVIVVAAIAAATVIVGGVPAQAAAPAEPGDRQVIGRSVDDRPIVARHVGSLDAPVQLVVIGQLHGNEPGGRKVIDRLSRARIPDGVGMWLITSVNPDGARAGTRVNARRVDLNRNFPDDWRAAGRRTDQWSGPRAASEPETRAVVRFLRSVQPTAVLGYHQAYDVVDISHRRSRPAGRQLARWMGERAEVVGCTGPCHGTMTQWVDAELGAIALTVELDSRVSAVEAGRAAAAVLRLGTWLGR